jgi:hypothetical protein
VLGYKNVFYQTKDHSLCNNEHWDCKQRKSVKGKQFILLQFDFVTPVLVEVVVFYGALSSDNRIVFFRSKSFFKPDSAVGLARF